jgi:hypothetical protein
MPPLLRLARDIGAAARSKLRQGIPAALSLLWSAQLQAACGALAPALEALPGSLPDVWWVRAERGDADAVNRGRVSNLLIVRDGARIWAVGSGPSRAFARALDCVVRRDLRAPISDVISPWPRPELVLGAAGLPRARHWAHADAARAMRSQCVRCVARLRQRLGRAATDLGDAPVVRLPQHRLHGASGTLGPFAWWRLERAAGTPLTLWRARAAGVLTAHGLLWPGDAPDLRDSSIAAMRAATAALAAIAREDDRLLGEQGAPARRAEIDAHQAYWSALDTAVQIALAQAQDATAVPRVLPGVDTSRTGGAAHALNWQRAWRQAEDMGLR